MRKIYILFSIASLLFIFSLINSCKKGGGECGNLKPKFYATKMSGETLDSIYPSQNITDSTVIRYDDLKISISFSGKHYSEAKSEFSLISSAYACDPVPPYSEEKITSITITSDQDFDSLHVAGTDLSDVFLVSRYSYDTKYTIEKYLKTEPKIENLEFTLILAPEIQKQIQFTITYNYNGRLVKVLKYDTPSFILSTY